MPAETVATKAVIDLEPEIETILETENARDVTLDTDNRVTTVLED